MVGAYINMETNFVTRIPQTTILQKIHFTSIVILFVTITQTVYSLQNKEYTIFTYKATVKSSACFLLLKLLLRGYISKALPKIKICIVSLI